MARLARRTNKPLTEKRHFGIVLVERLLVTVGRSEYNLQVTLLLVRLVKSNQLGSEAAAGWAPMS